MNAAEKIKNKVIISAQASKGEPFYNETALTAMMQSAVQGGAGGLRLAGAGSIKTAKKMFDVPVIGITKPEILPDNWRDIVYITPCLKDAEEIINAGADIIALDGTIRPRPKESLEEILFFIKQHNKPAMADISNYKEGVKAAELGFDIISTTLSGYTQNSDCTQTEPDFKLLSRLVKSLSCPVILEGRIWTPDEAKKAFDLGAYAVVIGSAVTRPKLITQRFVHRAQHSFK